MTNDHIHKGLLLFLLVSTTALTVMSMDLYAPSLPYLPEYFNTTPNLVKLTIALNSVTYGLGTLFYGPLSERFGRRPVLLGAMLGFTLSSFFCAVASSIEQLITARILLGFCAAAEGVLVYSIIADCFKGKDQVKAFSVWHAFCALVPIFAPILGAYIFLSFGWRANFVLLTGCTAVVTIMLWKYLLESREEHAGGFSLKQMFTDYGALFKSRRFISLALIQSTGVGYFVLFPTAMPFILANEYGMKADFFGYYQAGTIIAFMLGNFTTRGLVNRLAPMQVLSVGIGAVAAGCAVLWGMVMAGSPTLYAISVPIALISYGNGFVFTTVPPLAMNATKSVAGISAALLLTIQALMGSFTSLVDSILSEGTLTQFAMIMCVVALAAVFFCWLAWDKRKDSVAGNVAEQL